MEQTQTTPQGTFQNNVIPPLPVKHGKPIVKILIGVALLGIGVGVGWLLANNKNISLSPKQIVSTYDDCLDAKGSTVQESYPATCVASDGTRFTQPLTDEEKQNLRLPESTANWKRFTSERAGFSFQYPPDWPVNQCSIKETYQFSNQVEHIDFAEDCIPNATSESFGFVIVEKIDSYIKSPIDYVREREKSKFYITTVTAVQVGNTEGFLVTNQRKPDTRGGNFSPEKKRFYVIRDFSNFSLVYLIGLTNPKNLGWQEEKGTLVFDKTLSTFMFEK